MPLWARPLVLATELCNRTGSVIFTGEPWLIVDCSLFETSFMLAFDGENKGLFSPKVYYDRSPFSTLPLGFLISLNVHVSTTALY